MSISKSTAKSIQVQKEPSLSSYTDYRLYLLDWYEFKKRNSSSPVRRYSYATFSAAADIRSPNYLKLIIEGKRNLSEPMANKFAQAMHLNKIETREFIVLVHYTQAQDPVDRNRYLRELSELRIQKQIKQGVLKQETWEKLPGWVTWVLLAMSEQKGVVGDIKSLRELLLGRVSHEEIEKTLSKLMNEGELVCDSDTGELIKVNKVIQGVEEISAEQIRKLQGDLLYLGLESLFETAPSEREFGAFTVALTQPEFEQIKFELRQLRKRIYKDILVNREKNKGDRVYQLNIQLFPLTKAILDH